MVHHLPHVRVSPVVNVLIDRVLAAPDHTVPYGRFFWVVLSQALRARLRRSVPPPFTDNGNHLNELLDQILPRPEAEGAREHRSPGFTLGNYPIGGRSESGARIQQRHRAVFLYSVRLRFCRPFRAHRNKQHTQGKPWAMLSCPFGARTVSLLVLEYMS